MRTCVRNSQVSAQPRVRHQLECSWHSWTPTIHTHLGRSRSIQASPIHSICRSISSSVDAEAQLSTDGLG